MSDNPTSEKRKTPYFIPRTAPPTKEGVEALRNDFHDALARQKAARPSRDAVDFAIEVLRQVKSSDKGLAGQCNVAIEALSTLIPEGHRTALPPNEARDWAWNKLQRDVGTEGWTAADSGNYYGFYCHGWQARGQYEEQRLRGNNQD
jgi:hypothetical protein